MTETQATTSNIIILEIKTMTTVGRIINRIIKIKINITLKELIKTRTMTRIRINNIMLGIITSSKFLFN
jgi:hypothetical protein